MDKLRKIIMILRDYQEDSSIGYVINIEKYIEIRCEMLGIMDLKESIIDIIEKTKEVKTCKL
jgi:hypothetical protein